MTPETATLLSDCRRYLRAVEFAFAGLVPEKHAEHLGRRATDLAKRIERVLPTTDAEQGTG